MIKERVVQILEYKGIAKENFYKKIGVTSANFRGNAKKTPLNSFAIENILSEIPDLNAEWLLTGKGSMLKKEVVAGTNISQKVIGNDNITTGGSNNAILSTNNDKVIKELKTEVERLRSLLIEKEKQLTEKEKQITKLIDKLS